MNELTDRQPLQVPISAELRGKLGRVGVLFGGESAERDISLKSGHAVLTALQSANVNAVGVDIRGDIVEQLTQHSLDRAFVMLHGVGGEDGQIQALLSFLGVPYTGSGVQASSLAMDKLLCKQLWRGVGLPTPNFVSLSRHSDWREVIQSLGGTAMVKPAHEGSSLGMSLVRSPSELESAYHAAAKFDKTVIAEEYIDGPEYTVTIIGNEALPAIRLETKGQFYDYHAKYEAEDTRYLCPCGLPEEEEKALQVLSLEAYRSLGCRGWGRVDLMRGGNEQFYLLEVNTIPGMTDHSLVPMAAKAAGLSFEELVLKILLSMDL